MKDALKIHVKGIVQGVGFRPFVYRLARRYLISGWVLNAVDGVTIHAEGESDLVSGFVWEIAENAPASARVDEITMDEVPLEGFETFEIRMSEGTDTAETTLVSPDLATCDDCVRELFDPADRRYRYPFINCTNCGPRFTIIDGLPYDRPKTSMRSFTMCPTCQAEYQDPADRRFHAQPDACFACGPHLTWWEPGKREVQVAGNLQESDQIISRCVSALRAGRIAAIKGLGGFHLACNADSPVALAALRGRKHRDGKAFAVMMADVEAVKSVCEVSDEEAAVLTNAQHPIVLLKKRADAEFAAGLADDLAELGVMLPYTPLQHLIMHDFVEAGGRMLVMTSGNIHDEPICTDDEQARLDLLGIADVFLGNDRPILSRYDDSVVRVLNMAGESAVQVIRRARGFSPVPIALGGEDAAIVLAVGPEQKNTLCLARGGEAFVSQHIGDMENAAVYDAWLEAKSRYQELFRAEPAVLACDKHPEYLTTKWAHEQELLCVEVQHHHAHIASVLGEHQLTEPVCGFAFDGTGYGEDGAIWGGEVLLANQVAFERFANFAYVPMPGGASAVKNPLRMAYGVLWAFDLLEHPGAAALLEKLGPQAEFLDQMIDRGLNTPMTSSVGRLFDAAAALLGLCDECTYEGEPAVRLGALAMVGGGGPFDERYAIAITKNVAVETSTAQDTSVLLLDAAPVFQALLDDVVGGVDVRVIAERFHGAFARCILEISQVVQNFYGISTVALSGGVFMNRTLMELTAELLVAAGLTVAVNRDLPPNDGCVSFGQAVVAYAQMNAEE